ncbi:hypothetical protein C8R43DRAFT_1019580 [Mycena crocata]|nr:hypothetical protein C8R43DRAFT_1019580 [Mycena crocata]
MSSDTATSTQDTSAASTPSVSVSASACDPGNTVCVPSPGTLYLFTFLATLLLLTIVAGGIMSRTAYLRRRQRQLMAAGLWPTTPQRGRTDVNVKKKPRIFEVSTGEVVSCGESRHWDGLMPFSAIYESAPVKTIAPPTDICEQSTQRIPLNSIFSRRRHILRPSNNIPPSNAPATEEFPLPVIRLVISVHHPPPRT